MKAKFSPRLFVLVLSLAVIVVGLSGCATGPKNSFNKDFNEKYPGAPVYSIDDQGQNQFKLIVHQGSPIQGPPRILYMKKAADIIAASEAKKRGWQDFDLGYVQETDRGWMHVLVAEVTKKK